jgi:hypothetical protein
MTHITRRTSTDDAYGRRAALGHALARVAGILIVLAAVAAAFGGWVAVLL